MRDILLRQLQQHSILPENYINISSSTYIPPRYSHFQNLYGTGVGALIGAIIGLAFNSQIRKPSIGLPIASAGIGGIIGTSLAAGNQYNRLRKYYENM